MCHADFRTGRDTGKTEGGVLGHPAALPSTSCIQLIDLQLSQMQMLYALSPPFTP